MSTINHTTKQRIYSHLSDLFKKPFLVLPAAILLSAAVVYATGHAVIFEAETADLSHGAVRGSDSNASGGSYIEFKEPEEDPVEEPVDEAEDYLLMDEEDLLALPTSGTAWNNLKNVADGDLGTADISDQDNTHAIRTLGTALVYARTGENVYGDKAHKAVMAAIGTEEGGQTLALGRSLGAYVLAADFIRLHELAPNDDETFRVWLDDVRTKHIGNHGRWVNLTQTHENTANNWGTFAGASRLAASMYLDDTEDVDRVAQIFRGWTGDRSYYDEFQPTAAWDGSWACDEDNWVPVNPECVKDGINIDGALVEEVSRGGSLSEPPGSSGMSYSWEAMQGVVLQAELLSRAGYDAWNWSDQSLLRATDFLWRMGWDIEYTVQRYVPWIINARYGTDYPTRDAHFGRVFGYTDWLYGQ